mgnify:CR=1 FL=1
MSNERAGKIFWLQIYDISSNLKLFFPFKTVCSGKKRMWELFFWNVNPFFSPLLFFRFVWNHKMLYQSLKKNVMKEGSVCVCVKLWRILIIYVHKNALNTGLVIFFWRRSKEKIIRTQKHITVNHNDVVDDHDDDDCDLFIAFSFQSLAALFCCIFNCKMKLKTFWFCIRKWLTDDEMSHLYLEYENSLIG